MSDGIYVALSGAVAQEATLDATAQNLANASTPGYQRERSTFREVLSRSDDGARYTTSGTTLDTAGGAISVTDRPLDVALPPGSYLAVGTPRGERYTRAGSLKMNADGNLTAAGASVLAENEHPIHLDPAGGAVSLSSDGSVLQAGNLVARMRVVSFTKPAELAHEGGTLLTATPLSGPASITHVTLQTGAIEESNATVVSAMTDLVTASRTFDAFQKALDAFRDMDHKAVSSVAGTG